MPKSYYLTGIPDHTWKLFKASCDIQAITIKAFFLSSIHHAVSDFQANPEYTQGWPPKPKKGGKKT